jgi:hypothetical protein
VLPVEVCIHAVIAIDHALGVPASAVSVAPMGGGARVERARGMVRPRARGDAGCAETVHLLSVLRRFTRCRPRDHIERA